MEGFGLAPAIIEGEGIRYDSGVEPSNVKESETKWIELCYDPEDTVHSSYSELEATISAKDLTDDEAYTLITALANRFIVGHAL